MYINKDGVNNDNNDYNKIYNSDNNKNRFTSKKDSLIKTKLLRNYFNYFRLYPYLYYTAECSAIFAFFFHLSEK